MLGAEDALGDGQQRGELVPGGGRVPRPARSSRPGWRGRPGCRGARGRGRARLRAAARRTGPGRRLRRPPARPSRRVRSAWPGRRGARDRRRRRSHRRWRRPHGRMRAALRRALPPGSPQPGLAAQPRRPGSPPAGPPTALPTAPPELCGSTPYPPRLHQRAARVSPPATARPAGSAWRSRGPAAGHIYAARSPTRWWPRHLSPSCRLGPPVRAGSPLASADPFSHLSVGEQVKTAGPRKIVPERTVTSCTPGLPGNLAPPLPQRTTAGRMPVYPR